MRVADRLLSAVEPARRRSIARPPHGPHRARWTGFRSILCAIDFSQQSRRALRYAAEIAARRRAALRVIYVNDPLLTAAAAVALNDRELVARSIVELRTFVDSTIPEQARRALRLTQQVDVGSPTVAIMAAAEAAGADLIVVGTHGLTGARRVMLGSTTRELLRRTEVPILTVPRMRNRRVAPLSESWPGQVVAAVGLGRPGATEVDIAVRIAESFNSSLVLLHVVTPVIPPAWLKSAFGSHERDRAALARQRLAALITRARSRVSIDARVVSGPVADGLVSFAVKERAALVVLALQSTRGWLTDRRGSIAYSVLAHAGTPVLAYPAGWRPR
jgi:nucleotide-binding universal stress UspA family protein